MVAIKPEEWEGCYCPMVSVDPLVSGCGVAAPDGVHLYRGAALRVLKPVNQHQKTILSSALNDAFSFLETSDRNMFQSACIKRIEAN